MRCVVTTTFEGPPGVSAALELAAAVGERAWAHGLDSASTLRAPFPRALRPVRGELVRGGA